MIRHASAKGNRRRRAKSDLFQLRITLADIEPPIWRRVLIKGNTTLHELHRAIQLLFDWYDYHLYRFDIGDVCYEAPDEDAEGRDSTKATLSRLRLTPGQRLVYTYDFGDGWEHLIEIEEPEFTVDPDWLPSVIDGARRGPSEDSGGPHRYSELLTLLAKPFEDLDDDDRESVEWLGIDYDPEEFSVEQARHALLLASAWGVLKRKR